MTSDERIVENDIGPWQAGTQVRLKSDPGSIGICTGRQRERAGTVMVQATFPALGLTYKPEYELELVIDDDNDLYSLIDQLKFGRVSDLRRNLTRIQLSGRLANVIYSMETTNSDFYAYQYKPVLSFLESPSNGLLIADEVGLGKTIEAGLIWTELRARFDARRLLVVCPAMLCEKWKLELSRRFAVDAEITTAPDTLAALGRPKNEWPDGKAIIAGIQGHRPPRGWDEQEEDDSQVSARHKLARFLNSHAERETLVDLLVIDEAHYLRNPETQTAKLGDLLRAVSEHVVLLTATPINIKDNDLYQLLRLVDPDNFQYRVLFPEVLAANEPLVKARLKALDRSTTEEDIKALLSQARSHHLLTSNRQLELLCSTPMPPAVLNDPSERVRLANRIERVNLLTNVVSRTRKRDVHEFRVIRRAHLEKVQMQPSEAWFYFEVTRAIREYASSRDINDGFLLAPPQRQVSSCMVAAARAWQMNADSDTELLFEALGAEAENDEHKPLLAYIKREVLPGLDIASLEKCDSKYERLRAVLKDYFAKHPTEKVIVFSYYRGTLDYLHERLGKDGMASVKLKGGMQDKQAIIDSFHASKDVRLLLSSEVASEGVDLQFCRVLVNYDLPWNPVRVEQRIGRIDRLGQEAQAINIWNLCCAGTIDERILNRLYDRLHLFERALGGMEAILGEEIQRLTLELLSHHLTPEEEERRIEQTALALERKKMENDELESSASSLIAHGGYILEQVHAAHQFSRRISETDLLVYVRDYLERYAPGHEFAQSGDDPTEIDIRLPADTASRFDEFLKVKRQHGQTRLATAQRIKCRFVNKVGRGTARTDHISQFHPLVRFISDELSQRNEAYFPLIAVRCKQSMMSRAYEPGAYAFVVSLWAFEGIRTDEELTARVVDMAGGRIFSMEESLELVNAARLIGEDWLAAHSVLERDGLRNAIDACSTVAQSDYEKAARIREIENLDRVAFQKESLIKHKERRMKTLHEVRIKHQLNGRGSLVSATEGQIRSLEEKVSLQMERLTSREQFRTSHFEPCAGVIYIV